MDSKKIANRVSFISIIANLALTFFKLTAGLVAHSAAMVSDAIHSASDVLSTFVVIIGVNISSKSEDEGHQYGHEKIEAIFAIVLAVILFATGLFIGYSGIAKIYSGEYKTAVMPGALALVAAVVSIAVKEALYQYTVVNANKIKSPALKADAWHHRSDALSSVGSLIGIIGARLGYPICDPLVSAIICIFILKASVEIFKEAVNQLVDKACDAETEQKMRDCVLNVDGVICIDDLKTRLFGAKAFVDIEIGADGTLSLYEAHEIARKVHDGIERDFSEVKHCMVHVNPKKVENGKC